MGRAGGGVKRGGSLGGCSCCRLRHGTCGVPFCAARQMWLTCGHLSAKPPGCTMAWVCVYVRRGRKWWNGGLSIETFPFSFSVAVTPHPPLISPLGCTQPFPSLFRSFLFPPRGVPGQAASDKVLQNVVGSRETDCSSQT